jgi:hypothetical protein
MNIPKELKDISWQVSESTYRADPALSQSILSKFEREGFNKLDHLFDHISTQSLLEGSMVDCLITGSQEEFDNLYYVADYPSIGDKEQLVAKMLYEKYHDSYELFSYIPNDAILSVINEVGWQKNWRDETRVRVLSERIAMYYNLIIQAGNKTVVDSNTYDHILKMVQALKTSPATQGYFADNDSMSPIRRYYQLKFRAKFEGVCYRCMMDLAVVDYEEKKIYPIDLKTSGHKEWDFQDSFEQWSYMIQARLYWRILKANMSNDPYFKDFTLEDFRFIVVNKESLTPLVWEFPLTRAKGTLVNNEGKEFRDPFEIGKELQGYLNLRPTVPVGIDKDGINTITCLKQKYPPISILPVKV